MAPKRKAAAAAEPATEQISKLKKTIDEGAEELLCPITQELPIDPVTAEDGRVYERSAITEWLQQNEKSPHTNEPMGKQLFPATQVKNLISGMVKSGAITGDKAGAWTKKLEDEKEVEEERQKAERGDLASMVHLACWYRDGTHGLPEDSAERFKWAKRAAGLDGQRGHDLGLILLAQCYEAGAGVAQNKVHAISLFTQSATMGLDQACHHLADWYAYGDDTLPQDLERATYWAKKALDENHVTRKCSLREAQRAQCADWAKGNFAD